MEPQTPTTVSVDIKCSDSIKEIATALSNFQGEVGNAKKAADNPFFKSKYASFDALVDTIKGPLAKNGLSYTQWPVAGKLVTVLMHKSGEFMQGSVELKPADQKAQTLGSLITYMRRYTLSSILGIASEDDDDGNEASQVSASTKAVVKNEKVGAGDVYAQSVEAITKAKNTGVLFELQDKIANSEKLTDTQKNTLDKMISNKVDELTVNQDK